MTENEEMLKLIDEILHPPTTWNSSNSLNTARLKVLSAFASEQRREGAIEENDKWLAYENKWNYVCYVFIEDRNRTLKAQKSGAGDGKGKLSEGEIDLSEKVQNEPSVASAPPQPPMPPCEKCNCDTLHFEYENGERRAYCARCGDEKKPIPPCKNCKGTGYWKCENCGGTNHKIENVCFHCDKIRKYIKHPQRGKCVPDEQPDFCVDDEKEEPIEGEKIVKL